MSEYYLTKHVTLRATKGYILYVASSDSLSFTRNCMTVNLAVSVSMFSVNHALILQQLISSLKVSMHG